MFRNDEGYKELIDGESIDLDYTSAPVDPDNPGLDSLLSALKGFHEGNVSADILRKYHKVLSVQLENSRKNIEAMQVTEAAQDTKNLSIGALAFLGETLDRLNDYIDAPGPENLGNCVESFMRSRGALAFVHRKLDENIAAGKVEE